MTRTGVAAAAVLALLGAAGCTSDTAETPSASSVVPDDIQACDEIYVEGEVIDNETFGLACLQGEELISPRPVNLECTDGRTLVFNDLAWGYYGEGMTRTPDDDPSKMPETAVDECLAPGPGGATTTAPE
jgi:hypothetical protein